MTPREKAEAYVRGKLPELMELTPGCVVGHESSSENRYVIDFSFQPEGEVKQWALHSVEEQSQETITDRYMENHMDYLYGHPIQLQHWLRVLEQAKPGASYFLQHGDYIHKPTNTIKIGFNLTTGQPATEADYQAFNDIVGI